MRQLKIATQITDRSSQPFEKYLQEISRKQMITPEEEAELSSIILSTQPDSKAYIKALNRLVEANLRFVVSVAKQYQNQGIPLSDMTNDGNLGLIKAAKRFDHTKGFKFISYAVWRIRQSILQALAEQGRLVRIPQNKIGTINRISKAINAFQQEHERVPSDDELAQILEMNIGEMRTLLTLNVKDSSLDAEIGGVEGDGITLGDLLRQESDEISAVFNFPNSEAMTESVQAFLKAFKLKPLELEVILAYFGFNGITVEAIEQKFNIKRARIMQIKERVIKKLQKPNGVAMRYLHDDLTLPKNSLKRIQNINNNPNANWLHEKKPLGKPLQVGKPLQNGKLAPNGESIKTNIAKSIIQEIKTSTGIEIQETRGEENMPVIHKIEENNDLGEKLDTQFKQIKSIETYLEHGLAHADDDTIKSILIKINKTRDDLLTYKKEGLDSGIQEKVEEVLIKLDKRVILIEENKNIFDQMNIRYDKKTALLFTNKYDREKKLLVGKLNETERSCIISFMDYFGEVRIDSLEEKKMGFEEILKGGRLRCGKIINQEMYNEYVLHFLDSIIDL